jgi:hypothetical protein
MYQFTDHDLATILAALRHWQATVKDGERTASYFETQNIHGSRISISRSEPRNVAVDGQLTIFVPEQSILSAYKRGSIDTEGYINRYREQMRRSLPQIRAWLDSLDPNVDMTLLCWEKAGQFSETPQP